MNPHEKHIRSIAERVRSYISSRWPRDTGLSARSFSVDVTDDGIEVSNSTDYARYVHRKGTPRSQLAIDEIFEELQPQLDNLSEEAFESALREQLDVMHVNARLHNRL